MTPDLTTTYLGLRLRSPLVPSSSPLTGDLSSLRRLAEAGAGAVILPSLFMEQVRAEALALENSLEAPNEQYVEATSYLPEPPAFRSGAQEYCQRLHAAKKELPIPVIASLNGGQPGCWASVARDIEAAGADAIELNLYRLASDPSVTGSQVEDRDVQVVREVCAQVRVPVAVKLTPFYSALAHMASRFAAAGAKGLALFNRFYQPDIDLAEMTARPTVSLSRSADLRLPLRWTAILFGRVEASLALTGGVHSSEDALKALLAGADVAMLCSELLQNGPPRLGEVLRGLRDWMQERGYESVAQLKGSLGHKNCPDPEAFERAHYIKALTGFRLPAAQPSRV